MILIPFGDQVRFTPFGLHVRNRLILLNIFAIYAKVNR